jgi:PKD repeat protein
MKRKVCFLTLVFGLSLCFTPALATVTNVIQTISPSSAPQATNGLVVTFTLSTSAPPPPPANIQVTSVLIGTNAATAFSRPETNSVTNIVVATFDIPNQEPVGNKDVLIRYQGTNVVTFKASGFYVSPATTIVAGFTASPTNGVPPLTVNFTDASTPNFTNRLWDFGDGSTDTGTNPVHTYYSSGSYNVSLTIWGPLGSNTLTRAGFILASLPPTNGAYVVVDTAQTNCYNNSGVIPAPAPGQPFYGQDAQIQGHQPAYTNNGDGTITDLNTGLMWVQARGTQQVTWAYAVSNVASCRVGGYSDWRMPTIKELYSLAEFTGANGQSFTNTAGYIPFIDTNYFGFAYGPGTSDNVGSRVIDAQDWSATPYVSTVMNGQAATFGFNFTDGRIKGYPPANSNYVRYVRGNTSYGLNNFVNNGDGTITDKATRLMWSRSDSGAGMNWSNALAWVQAQNAAKYLGYNDWRLPNSKELQTIVDYTRSPDATLSAAINPVFNCTAISNENQQLDWPWYWSSTTLVTSTNNAEGVYICFGRAMGYQNGWVDAHGVGAQRSDPKGGSLSSYTYVPYGYYSSLAPQGDAIRIYNYVRLVRDIPVTNTWRFAFVGDTHVPLTAIPAEIASAVVNDDAKFLIIAGDVTESGTDCSLSTFTSQLTTWRSEMAPLANSGIPLYVVRGNHEDDVPNGLAEWTNFFSGAYSMPTNGPAGEIDLTYSTALTYSNALFVGLDDYVNIHEVDQPWLNQQLANNRLPHIFVYGHEPAFKAFHTDCLGSEPSARNTFWSSLTSAGAKVYLCGHDHFFNVARIDNGDGNPTNDLYQFIVGTGGSTNWPPQLYNCNGTNAPYTPINLWNITETYGYLLVEISGPGTNDLGVTMTWKQRTYDTSTASYIYVATTNVFTYSAVNRSVDSVGDGIPDWWRAQYFGGTGTTTNSSSCATCDPDHDGVDNYHEYIAGTNPTNALSYFQVQSVSNSASGLTVFYQSSWGRNYTLYFTTNLVSGAWLPVPSQAAILGDGGVDALTDSAAATNTVHFYRVGVSVP